MKKPIIYFIVLLLTMSIVFAASVSRELPSRADPNSELTVKLQVSGADTTGLFTLEEELPEGMTVKDWTVTGATESKADISTRVQDGRYGWSFTPSGGSATVEYTIDLGSSDVTFGSLIYFDVNGQGKADPQTLRVAPITCGDGICEGGENTDTCEADCPKPAPPTPPVEAPKALEGPGKAPAGWIILAIIVVIGVIGYFVYQKKKKGSA